MRSARYRHAIRLLAGCTAVLVSISASASSAPSSEIVVSGQVLSKEEAETKARAYVQAVGMVTTVKPAARWMDRICPKVMGLGDANLAARAENRIRTVATEVGARLAKPGCDSNLVVIFTDNADDLARRINVGNPRLMAEATAAWRGRLIDGRVPIRWWYQSAVRNADGMGPTSAPLPWLGIETGGGPASGSLGSSSSSDVGGDSDSGGGTNTSNRSSMVSTNVKRALSGATILIDVDLANGKDLQAVTDYATLVGLAEIRFQGEPPPDSILALFASSNPTDSLTVQDMSLLKSLYRLPLDRHGRYHRSWLVKDVSKALSGGK